MSTQMPFQIHACDASLDAPAILAIFNDAIAHSTALYEYVPRTLEFMKAWFSEKATCGHPVLGAYDDAGQLLGFATYGMFRSKPAYKYTVEHSVYLTQNAQGRGVASALMRALIDFAQTHEVHCMVGVIDSTNQASIVLHERLGFRHVGTMSELGFKFGQWLDAAFYQLLLDAPKNPVDG